MDGFQVKEVMDQVHIPSEMQEEIIENLHKRMEQGNQNRKRWNLRNMTAAAVFVLVVSAVSFPALAFVANTLKARMESVSKEELEDLNDMVQSQQVLADGFSREYSAKEKERSKELWKAYENGTFPENVISVVEHEDAAVPGTLCYIRATGTFNLPAQELTDEELLEIIDFQHKMSYAVMENTKLRQEESWADQTDE